MNIQEIRQKYPQYSDVSDIDLAKGLHQKYYSDMPIGKFMQSVGIALTQADLAPSQADRAMADPTRDMGTGERLLAGAGKAFSDIGLAARQIASPTESGREQLRTEARERAAQDAPLMETGAGMAGNIGGNVAAMLPLAAVPGAGTVVGGAIAGGVMGALQPEQEKGGRLSNVGIGSALGGVGQKIAGTVAGALETRAANKLAAATTRQAQKVPRDATLREAQKAGYVVPPSAVNPTFVGNRLEGVAGKAAIKQQAEAQNQEVTNALARKALNMAEDQPLSEGALEAYRKAQGKVYAEVTKLSRNAEVALERLKDARNEAKNYWIHYNRSADPNSLRNAKHFDAQVKMLDKVLEREALKGGRPDLIPSLKQARRQIAKSYDIEKALNEATGDVDAKAIGRLFDKKGPRAMTGELATIGKFANSFPQFSRAGAKVPPAGVSKLEGMASLALAMGGAGLAGPIGLTAAAIPFASSPVRSALLSRPVQNMLAQPKYSRAPVNQLLAKALPPERAEAITRFGAVPAYFSGD